MSDSMALCRSCGAEVFPYPSTVVVGRDREFRVCWNPGCSRYGKPFGAGSINGGVPLVTGDCDRLISQVKEPRVSDFPAVFDWPQFSDGGHYLCVVRDLGGEREHGFLLQGSWNVNLGYVWDGGTGEFLSYRSRQDLEDAGWRVD